MVRLVNSGSLLPGGRPLGWSIRPAGPFGVELLLPAESVCLETPTRAAKSPAGRPLRCQVSSSSSRCSGEIAGGRSVGWANRGLRPAYRPPSRTGDADGPLEGRRRPFVTEVVPIICSPTEGRAPALEEAVFGGGGSPPLGLRPTLGPPPPPKTTGAAAGTASPFNDHNTPSICSDIATSPAGYARPLGGGQYP